MYCSQCGKRNIDSSNYCLACGAKLIPVNNSLSNREVRKNEVLFNNINTNNSTIPTNYQSNYGTSQTPKKKNNGLKAVFALVFVIVLIVVLLNSNSILATRNGKRTIMIYMVGSNLESEYGAATIDLNEMVNSKADFENINLLVYTGGSKNWRTENISSNENAVFKVNANGIEKVKTYPKNEMGKSSTLLQFLNFTYDNYKAESYGLIFWDHGGGPIHGYGLDEFNTSNSLSINEIRAALASSRFNNQKLEFIGFDACLMSSIEVAHSVKDYAKYMIASEESEPGDGWNYEFLGDIKRESNGQDIGKIIIDSYASYYSKYNTNGITIALMDLSKVKDVEEKINNLFNSIDSNLNFDFSNISRTRNKSKSFGKASSSSFDLVDLYDLAENMPSKYKEYSNSLEASIKNFVIYQKTDMDGAHGVSIYFPYENKKEAKTAVQIFATFKFANNYYLFIKDFVDTLTGDRIYSWNTETLVPSINENGDIEVGLPKEILENYSRATYIIFEEKDGYYIPRFQGTDVEVNANKLVTSISNKGIVATDNEDNSIYLMAFEGDKGTNYTKYLLPGIVQKYDEEEEKTISIPVFVHFVVNDDNPSGIIEGVTETNPNSELSSKTIIDVDEYKTVNFLGSSLYKIFDENGLYNPNWESNSSLDVEILSSPLNEIKIEFVDLNINKDYYVVFLIEDSQGNTYSTNVTELK